MDSIMFKLYLKPDLKQYYIAYLRLVFWTNILKLKYLKTV